MKRAMGLWQMGGFLFTAIAGTLLHFLFDLTGRSGIAAVFSPVNESIWEHLKLLFYPMLGVTAAEYFSWGRVLPSFLCIKLTGILTGMGLIVTVYYTVSGILGGAPDWFNITLFFVAAAAAFWLEARLFQRGFFCRLGKKPALALLILLAVLFTRWTFAPPQLPLFRDSRTGTYGLAAQIKSAGNEELLQWLKAHKESKRLHL